MSIVCKSTLLTLIFYFLIFRGLYLVGVSRGKRYFLLACLLNSANHFIIYWSKYNSVCFFLPAAGYRTSAGALVERGGYGYYWASTVGGASNGGGLYFASTAQYAGNLAPKSYGFSVRCVAAFTFILFSCISFGFVLQELIFSCIGGLYWVGVSRGKRYFLLACLLNSANHFVYIWSK